MGRRGTQMMTVGDLEKLVEATEKWATSPAGKRALDEVKKRVEETTAFLSNERIVDGQILQMPMSL